MVATAAALPAHQETRVGTVALRERLEAVAVAALRGRKEAAAAAGLQAHRRHRRKRRKVAREAPQAQKLPSPESVQHLLQVPIPKPGLRTPFRARDEDLDSGLRDNESKRV